MALERKLPTVRELLERKSEECFSTGSLWLDLNIEQQDKVGRYGVPSRTLVEAYGFPRTGKTLLGESLATSVLNRNPEYEVIFLLAEEPNLERLVSKGLDPDRCLVWTFAEDMKERKPNEYVTAEDGLDMILQYIGKGRYPVKWEKKDGKEVPTEFRQVKMVMIDSMAALLCDTDVYDPKGNIKSMIDTAKLANRASLIKSFLLRWEGQNQSDSILFMTNHRSTPFQMPGQPYIPRDFNPPTPGGNFMSFSSFLQIECNSTKLLNSELSPVSDVQEISGMDLIYKVVTNKHCTSTLGRVAFCKFVFEDGCYKKSQEIVKISTGIELVKVAGSWITIGTDDAGKEIKVQGEEQFQSFLDENPEWVEKLEKQIYENKDKLFPKGKSSKIKLKTAGRLNSKESK